MAWTWICQKYLQVRGPWDSPNTRVFKQLSQYRTQPPLSSRLFWSAGNQQWSLLTSFSLFPKSRYYFLGEGLKRWTQVLGDMEGRRAAGICTQSKGATTEWATYTEESLFLILIQVFESLTDLFRGNSQVEQLLKRNLIMRSLPEGFVDNRVT